jgi:hypothetical protein
MEDLVDYKNKRITALMDKVAEQDKRIALLETWLFEATSEGCPEGYKKVIRTELLKTE